MVLAGHSFTTLGLTPPARLPVEARRLLKAVDRTKRRWLDRPLEDTAGGVDANVTVPR
jgi:hypothetical protein